MSFKKEKTKIKTVFGEFDFYCYSWGDHEEDNILCTANLMNQQENVLVRVQSACYTAEIFRSLDCDCHEQLETSLRRIAHEGGVLIYMLCDGRGAGLLNKVKGLELGISKGMDTADAYNELGLKPDPREYDRVIEVLKDLNIKSVKLLTNNPRKMDGLKQGGINVMRESLEIQATEFSRDYLKTKTKKMGHMMKQFEGQKED